MTSVSHCHNCNLVVADWIAREVKHGHSFCTEACIRAWEFVHRCSDPKCTAPRCSEARKL